MTSCCACCCFYPKYKRRVDSIYARSLDAPLVKTEVDKLQYYAKIHPEKLSKIGDYLYQNLKWGLSGTYKNRNYVKNTVTAVDKILLVITPQDLNYYAGNYLKIVKKLLEQQQTDTTTTTAPANGIATTTSNSNAAAAQQPLTAGGGGDQMSEANSEYLEYQKMAASLFQKFCDKEAANLSMTSYSLNYDTFVCQFSVMCYNNNRDEVVRGELRSSGLQCLATMVKRLVPDDSLRAGYLWDNMDKIVPALLFIMHESFLNNNNNNNGNNNEHDCDEAEDDADLERYMYGEFFAHTTRHRSTATAATGRSAAAAAAAGDTNDDTVRINMASEPLEPKSVSVEFKRQQQQQQQPAAKKSSSSIVHQMSSKQSLNNNNDESKASSTDETGAMLAASATTPVATVAPPPPQPQLPQPSPLASVDPDHEAKMLLKTLASKADYTTISKIVLPILAYLDDNKPCGWEYTRFVRCVFLILMYNVKQQHAIVIKELIKHLDSHRNSSAQLKCQIIKAISSCIQIAAMHSVGTTGQIIEIFTNLLKHLNFSVERLMALNASTGSSSSAAAVVISGAAGGGGGGQERGDQQRLQHEIILAMGEFAGHLPDYAKNDVIMFIARQINSQQISYTDLAALSASASNHSTLSAGQGQQQQQPSAKDQFNLQLRVKYFECLLEICTKYRPTQLFGAFTGSQFLEDILKLTLVADWSSRRRAHHILHQLMDKHRLVDKIRRLKPSLAAIGEAPPPPPALATDTTTAHAHSKQQSVSAASSPPTLNKSIGSRWENKHFLIKKMLP